MVLRMGLKADEGCDDTGGIGGGSGSGCFTDAGFFSHAVIEDCILCRNTW